MMIAVYVYNKERKHNMRTQRKQRVIKMYEQGKIVAKYGLLPIEREMLVLITYKGKIK
jgi:hypothetical protein